MKSNYLTIILFLYFLSTVSAQYVTHEQFKCMFPRVSDEKIRAWIPELNSVLKQYSITNLMRVWMFMAQTGHETDRYNTFVEYTNKDGTNAWCHKYDGGCKYRGRGAIQLTHKYNYDKAGKELGANFVGNPDLVATNQYAFKTAGLYWRWRNLNEPSDRGDIVEVTRRVNGGTKGVPARQVVYDLAKKCIKELGGSPPSPAPSPAPSPPPNQPKCPTEYIVEKGDTLSRIANRFNVTVNAIVKANNIKNPNLIYVGQKLIIPCPTM